MQFQMPKSKFLKFLIGWMIAAVFLKVVRIIQGDNLDAGQLIGYFALGFIFRFLLGAFWSGFPYVYLPAWIAAAVFIAAVTTTRGPNSMSAAKYAITAIVYLSLFSIWVEPWLNAFGLIANLFLIFFGMFSIILEVCATVGWLFLWGFTYDELATEL
jgi:hypothetical protein